MAAISVLLDNSTYFSFKGLLEGRHLDADTLYNAATFLECLVAADEIVTAPTLAWSPDSSDELFQPGAPCRSIAPSALDDQTLSLTFYRAIHDSIRDLAEPTLPQFVGTDSATIQKAQSLMHVWLADAQRSPREFMSVYSGGVYLADPAAKAVISRLNTGVVEGDDPGRHLAQFLLRINAALGFTTWSKEFITAYHPHSYRVPFVVAKLTSTARRSRSLAVAVLQDFEANIHESKAALRESTLAQFGAFMSLGDDAPLVLAVALSGAQTPEDVLQKALVIRNTSQARRYRLWIRAIFDAILSHDVRKQLEANSELLAARRVLVDELKRLYGTTSSDIIGTTTRVASAIDLEAVVALESRKLLTDAITGVARVLPAVRNLVERGVLRHKIALLVQLARHREHETHLNDLLMRAFRTNLSTPELERFKQLREQQLDSARAIFSK